MYVYDVSNKRRLSDRNYYYKLIVMRGLCNPTWNQFFTFTMCVRYNYCLILEMVSSNNCPLHHLQCKDTLSLCGCIQYPEAHEINPFFIIPNYLLNRSKLTCLSLGLSPLFSCAQSPGRSFQDISKKFSTLTCVYWFKYECYWKWLRSEQIFPITCPVKLYFEKWSYK